MVETKKTSKKKETVNIAKAKKAAIEAARAAGKILLKHFKTDINIIKKGHKDYYTEVDLKCEKAILRILKKEFPSHSIYSEEIGFIDKGSEFVWYVDPLDGTHNYMHGTYPWGTSIGLTQKKESILGVIYMPLVGEMYIGIKGKGATCNGKKIAVSKNKEDQAMIEWTSRVREANRLADMLKFANAFEMIRFKGAASANCTWLAAGHIEGMVSHKLPPHDIAAGYVIMKEAGAKITDFNGKAAKFDNREFIITNGKIHKTAVKIMKQRGNRK